MTDVARCFIDESRRLLRFDYMPKLEKSLAPLSPADVWWRPNDASNSIGNLVLHLKGNVTQWIIGGVGQRPFVRDRQREFDTRGDASARELLDALHATIAQADDVLANLGEASLLERRKIQNYDVNVLEAVYHVVEHFGMHTGQIIVISKSRLAQDLQLWKPNNIAAV